jgi:small subunit ribosomal protein S21
MPGVRVKEEEPFESVLKRFKKQCEKPSVKKKKKTLAARKRALKKLKKMVR